MLYPRSSAADDISYASRDWSISSRRRDRNGGFADQLIKYQRAGVATASRPAGWTAATPVIAEAKRSDPELWVSNGLADDLHVIFQSGRAVRPSHVVRLPRPKGLGR